MNVRLLPPVGGRKKNWKWTVKKLWKASCIIQLYEKFGGLPEPREWLIDIYENDSVTLRLNEGEQIYEMDISKFYRKFKENKRFRERMKYIENEVLIKFWENYE